jgi:hypothetical protein
VACIDIYIRKNREGQVQGKNIDKMDKSENPCKTDGFQNGRNAEKYNALNGMIHIISRSNEDGGG